MPLATSKQKHLLAPDLLRCLAIVMVVVYHISAPIAHDWIDFTLYPLSRYTFFPVSFFWTGVALFFVLSGFCIHLSYLKASNLTWGKFFWLRFWRLYPAYILAVAFFLVVTRVNLHGSSRIMQLVLHAAFLHNISAQYFFGINPAFWSLATEVQLYLLFPFVIFFRQRWGIERCLVVTALVAVLARVLVCILWGFPDHLGEPAFSSPFTSWFDWTLGAYVAERFTQNRFAFGRHILWLLLLIPLFFVSTISTISTALLSFSIAAVISAVILDVLVTLEWPNSYALDIAAFIGTISYSLYLWHQPLIFRLTYYLRFLPDILKWTVTLTLILAIATLSWFFIEKNGVKLGKVLWKKHLGSDSGSEVNTGR